MTTHIQKTDGKWNIPITQEMVDFLNITDETLLTVCVFNNGLYLRPVTTREAYEHVTAKHRVSLDELE